MSKKKLGIIIVIIVAILLSIIIVYFNNASVMDWVDKNIFRKEVMQDNVNTIELKDSQNANIHAFHKYIGVLNKNKFTIYGNTGNEEKSLEML